MSSYETDTYRETVLSVDAGAALLHGVYASPTQPSGPGPCALLLSAGLLGRAGAQRMNVELARALASEGVASYRFDLSGLGDSPARSDALPFAESQVLETQAVMDALAARDHTSFVLIGLCSGADQAFWVGRADARVSGAVLIDGFPYPTRRFRAWKTLRPFAMLETYERIARGEIALLAKARAFIQRGRHASDVAIDPGLAVRTIPPQDEARAGYHELLERGVRLFVIYTAGQLGTYNYGRQFSDMHPSVAAHEGVAQRYFSDADHTFTQARARRELVRSVVTWIGAAFA